jgi:hypothetical protein
MAIIQTVVSAQICLYKALGNEQRRKYGRQHEMSEYDRAFLCLKVPRASTACHLDNGITYSIGGKILTGKHTALAEKCPFVHQDRSSMKFI